MRRLKTQNLKLVLYKFYNKKRWGIKNIYIFFFLFFFLISIHFLYSRTTKSIRDKGKKGWFVTSLRRFASFIRRNTESLTKVHVEKGRNRGIVGKESFKKNSFFFSRNRIYEFHSSIKWNYTFICNKIIAVE